MQSIAEDPHSNNLQSQSHNKDYHDSDLNLGDSCSVINGANSEHSSEPMQTQNMNNQNYMNNQINHGNHNHNNHNMNNRQGNLDPVNVPEIIMPPLGVTIMPPLGTDVPSNLIRDRCNSEED